MVTSSTLVLKWGVHGGSTMGRHGSPMVGDGKTKSMLGGGIWHHKHTYSWRCQSKAECSYLWFSQRSAPVTIPREFCQVHLHEAGERFMQEITGLDVTQHNIKMESSIGSGHSIVHRNFWCSKSRSRSREVVYRPTCSWTEGGHCFATKLLREDGKERTADSASSSSSSTNFIACVTYYTTAVMSMLLWPIVCVAVWSAEQFRLQCTLECLQRRQRRDRRRQRIPNLCRSNGESAIADGPVQRPWNMQRRWRCRSQTPTWLDVSDPL